MQVRIKAMHSRLTSTTGMLLASAIGVAGIAGSAAAEEQLVVDTVFQLKTADPARAFEPTASLFMHTVYETLVTFDGGDVTRLVPGLAGLPTVNEDATVFTFALDPDARFSDGTQVTADDVVFSLTRLQTVKGTASFMIRDVVFEVGEAEGEIVVTTPSSDPGFPAKLTYPALSIMNADLLRENGGSNAEDAAQTDTADQFLATASAGSGPYVLAKYDPVSEVVLERNDNHWGEPAAFDRIIIRNVANSAQRMNISRAVSDIAIDLRPDQIAALGDEVNVISAAGSDTAFVFTNRNPEVSEVAANPDFTEAVRYAIDYEGMLDLLGAGAGRAGGIVPSILMGTLDGAEAVERDLDRARAALERLGVESPTVNMAYASDIAKHGISFGDIGAKIQSDLAEVGITVNLVPEPVATNLDGYRAGTLEMSVQWFGPAYPDPSYYDLFNPGRVVGLRAGWPEGSSPEIESAAAAAGAAVDPAVRPGLYEDWQRVLMQSGPYVPLFQPPTTIVSTGAVENVIFNPTWTVDLDSVTPASN